MDVALGEDDSRIRTGPAAHHMALPSAWPTTCCGRTDPQGGHRPQAAGGSLEQGLSVPTDRPQAQTRLDAIALVLQALVRGHWRGPLGAGTVCTAPWTCRSRRTTAAWSIVEPLQGRGQPIRDRLEQGAHDSTAIQIPCIHRAVARPHRTPALDPGRCPKRDFAFALVGVRGRQGLGLKSTTGALFGC